MRLHGFLVVLLGWPLSSASAQPSQQASPPAPSGFWVGAAIQQDIGLLPGGDVCSRTAQSNRSYSCFRSDREQYLGVPVPGQPASLAAGRGTTRVMIHAEHVLFNNFTLGGRVGFAFGGGPMPSKGPPFIPLHLEGRLAYWIGPKLSPAPGLRGFVMLSGGLAQIDASRRVTITECRPGDPSGCIAATGSQPGGPNPDSQTLEASKKAGIGFFGAGAGLYYSFVRGSGVVLDVKATQLFPSLGFAISPSIAYVFHAP